MKRPIPRLAEAHFTIDELFFSTTDSKGILKFGNDIFLRVSGYSKEEIIGKPHNMVRHPDMPKAVFKLFWEFLQDNKAIGAYVKNLAADGSYYWVFAFAFPVEGGYLSIRFKPTSHVFEQIQNLYRQLLEVERKDGVEKAYSKLQEAIKELGYRSYDQFMTATAIKELHSRELALSQRNESFDSDGSSTLRNILATKNFTSFELDSNFKRIEKIRDLNLELQNKISNLSHCYSELAFLSINMQAASDKLGKKAATLVVVSSEFSKFAEESKVKLSYFSNLIAQLSDVIESSTFSMTILKIQMLMVDYFVRSSVKKIGSTNDAFSDMNENKNQFVKLFDESVKNLMKDLHDLKEQLSKVHSNISEVQNLSSGLEIIKQVGTMESARDLEVEKSFQFFLKEMSEFIKLLKTTVWFVDNQSFGLNSNVQDIAQSSEKVADKVQVIFELALKLDEKAKAA